MAATHDQLRKTVDLISQPLFLEMLLAAESGQAPRDAAPSGANPAELRAALQKLTTMGAISSDAVDIPLILTPRGEELIQLFRELEAAVPQNPTA